MDKYYKYIKYIINFIEKLPFLVSHNHNQQLNQSLNTQKDKSTNINHKEAIKF